VEERFWEETDRMGGGYESSFPPLNPPPPPWPPQFLFVSETESSLE
jgi:hypothetical protein